MQKVLYLLTTPGSGDELRERLLGETAPALLSSGAYGVQVNVTDSDVEAAAGAHVRSGSGPHPDAVVAVWMDSANPDFRAVFDGVIVDIDPTSAAYLVAESEPLSSELAGGRSPGFSQVAFLQRPPRLTQHEWRTHWLGHHTRVAIETQSTFRYVQNQVLWALTPDAPPCEAIVEECFPTEAMSDPAVFFDAADDPERLKQNMDTMMASVGAFLDFDKLDVIPTSEYVVRTPASR
jgi:hypothetical protein